MNCPSDELAEAFRAISWTVTRLVLLVSIMSVNGASTNVEDALYK